MEPAALRIYLTGDVAVYANTNRLYTADFPGRQGRLAFAYLALHRGRPVSHVQLADLLWSHDLPKTWEMAESALISKLRAVIIPFGGALLGAHGLYELVLPPSVWIDVEAASASIQEAETAMRRNDWPAVYGPSAVALNIGRRPFFPIHSGHWVDAQRDRLRDVYLRALEIRSAMYLWNHEETLAIQHAKEIVTLEPFREAAYRLLMRAHAAMGNLAEALRAYEECRRLLQRELGVGPSPQTRAVHEAVLRGA
jgi:DNA-binding SARP family transcriptional activator